MTQALMIVPPPINWEARVWEKRYNQAMNLLKEMMLNDMGNAELTRPFEILIGILLRQGKLLREDKLELEASILDFFVRTGRDPLVAEHFGIQIQRTGYIYG